RPRAFHAAALRAGLADAVVLAGRLDNAPALADVVADGLFDVDVLAGLHGPDRGQRVPVVGRGDADDVDGLVVEDAAQVFLVLGREALGLLGGTHRPLDDGLVHVADRGHDAVVPAGEAADVAAAAAVDADDRDAEPVVGVALLRGLLVGPRQAR